MSSICCFGELLLRMSPALGNEWIHQKIMPVYIGGAELNVAVALAKWDVPVKYVTALPANYLSEEIAGELEAKNIDTSAIRFSGERIGIYYLPQGADLKHAGVIYDRSGSSFSELKTGMLDWEKILDGCSWFHFSAICPALNENAAAVCKEALQAASAKGLTISVDLNYRNKLWQYGKRPVEIMPRLLEYCHVAMGNIWAVENLLGVTSIIKESKGKTKEELIDGAGESIKQVLARYPGIKTMAYTFRLEGSYFAMLHHEKETVVSKEFETVHSIDKVGTGDSFMGGLIYGLYNKVVLQKIIDFAASAAVGKMQEKGDGTNQTVMQILQRI
jgi:2-dehydro-3-deoxygluconokinase